MAQIMHDSVVLRVDPASVVHETLDGETILIHLASGTYFSLTGSGPAVWDLLVSGCAVGVTAATVAGTDAGAQEAVRDFIGSLLAEDLLVTSGGDATATPVAPPQSAGDYAPPVLARYDDMEYLLLLDPIHEASDNGWPALPADGAPA